MKRPHKRTGLHKTPQFAVRGPKGSDENLHARQVTFDDWVKLFHFDATLPPLFEVVFPRRVLEQREVYDFMYKEKIKAHNYGHDEETIVAYFNDKFEAKELRDVVKPHWGAVHVSAGPLHRKYAALQ